VLILNLAARNLLRNSRRSLLVGSLIAACVVIAIIGNSFFQSSVAGLRRTFIDCFTGDLFVAPRIEAPLSLFGEDIPVIGAYSPIPVLPKADSVDQIVRQQPGVASAVFQISGYALMEIQGIRNPVVLFGVDGDGYFGAFDSVRLVRGTFLRTEAPGLMISEKSALDIGKMTGHEPAIGDPVQLSVFTNRGFSIREVPLAGTFEYPVSNAVLDRISYVDSDTLRALNGMIQGSSASENLPKDARTWVSGDLQGIFDSKGTETTVDSGIRLSDVERALAASGPQDKAKPKDAGSWNFLVIKLASGTDLNTVKRDLEEKLRSAGLEARVGDWKAAAGSGAALAGSLSLAFNVGLGLLAIVIILVLANSFVALVTERTSEIATMRAVGAPKRFVRSLFLGEATVLCILSGAAGVILGSLLVAWMHRRGFATDNRIISMVFGGRILRPLLTPGTLVAAFLGSIVIGGAASLFAVRFALRIHPARAMESE